MPSKWLINNGLEIQGPYSPNELRSFVTDGILLRSHLVKEVNGTKWRQAYEVPGLFEGPCNTEATPPAVGRRPRKDSLKSTQHTPVPPPPLIASSRSSRGSNVTPMLISTIGISLGMFCLLIISFIVMTQTQTPTPQSSPKPQMNSKLPESSKDETQKDGSNLPKETAPTENEALPIEKVISTTETSVALIRTPLGFGSGFAVHNGIIATNKHVISSSFVENIEVFLPSEVGERRGPFPVRKVFDDPTRDLAFLQIEMEPRTLSLADDSSFRRGQEVIAIGSPGLGGKPLANAVSRGLISSQVVFDRVTYFQLDISVNPGNSGGPVIDRKGKVVGIVTLRSVEEEGLGFCIPANEIKKSLGNALTHIGRQLDEVGYDHDAQATILIVLELYNLLIDGLSEYVGSLENGVDIGMEVQRSAGLEFPKLNSYLELITQQSDSLRQRFITLSDLSVVESSIQRSLVLHLDEIEQLSANARRYSTDLQYLRSTLRETQSTRLQAISEFQSHGFELD